MQIFKICVLVFVLDLASALPRYLFGTEGRNLNLNGQPASLGELPYYAFFAIFDIFGRYSQCGGSFIRYNFVLTAAHCINGIPTMTVFGGHVQWHTHEEFVERATPENFIVHENWRAHLPHLHNVGLIRLFTTTPALFDGPFVKQIALPTLPSDQTNSFEGFTIRAMGFGTGHRLRSGLTRVISNQECSQQNIETIWSGNLCVTHTDDMNPCRHDDGSPGVVNRNGEDVVLAIFSIGRDDCNVGSPAIYVRVTSYLDWIHHHINM